jgi:hypothetical protein
MNFQFNKGPLFDGAQPRDFALSAHEFGVYGLDTIQRFMFGTRYITWDGKVYKYSLANGVLNPNQGCEQLRPQEVSFAAIVSGSLGATDLICTVGASDGVAGDGVILKDGLAGGNFVIFDNSAKSIRRTIVGNSVVDGANPMTIFFDVPMDVLLTTSDVIEAHSSPYLDVTPGGSSNRTIIGLPTRVTADGDYTWLQTWGVCWISPQADVGTVTAGSDQLVFRHDGSVETHDAGSATTKQSQHAGFVMTWGQGDPGGQGAPMMMLQISI